DAAGNAPLGNGIGVYLWYAHHNTVGGVTAGAGNVISGTGTAIHIAGGLSAANVIQGNYIGTNAAGILPLGDSHSWGIRLEEGDNQLIGGTEVGAGNVIANYDEGIRVDSSNGHRIQGNRIGTDLAGTEDLGCVEGIHIGGGTNILIGGRDEDDGTSDG